MGAITAVALAVSAAIGKLWSSEKDAQRELTESLKRQALSSETARIAADQAKSLAEKRAGELEMRYGYLRDQYKRAVAALNAARVRVDPGAMVGSVPPAPSWDDPSAVWNVEGERQAGYFLSGRAEREEHERRRQRPLNPSAERRERDAEALDWFEGRAPRYLAGEDSDPPTPPK